MKRFIGIFISLLLVSQVYSLDTNIVKYMPLKVGNVWVYHSFSAGLMRYTITGTQVQNGHTYYVFTQSGNPCFCSLGNYPPYLTNILPMRIDSATGNVLFLGASCGWHTNEHLLDSLRRKPGDSLSNSCNTTWVIDTSAQSVFGSSRKAITVDARMSVYGSGRKYAYGIGMFYSSITCTWIPNSSCINSLYGCVIDGVVYGDTSFPVGVSQISTEVPKSFSLFQNYPNPFNPSTTIKFDIPVGNGRDRSVLLKIYNSLGQEVAVLVNEQIQPGTYEVDWNGTNFASGVYYYSLQAGDYLETKKMLMIK